MTDSILRQKGQILTEEDRAYIRKAGAPRRANPVLVRRTAKAEAEKHPEMDASEIEKRVESALQKYEINEDVIAAHVKKLMEACEAKTVHATETCEAKTVHATEAAPVVSAVAPATVPRSVPLKEVKGKRPHKLPPPPPLSSSSDDDSELESPSEEEYEPARRIPVGRAGTSAGAGPACGYDPSIFGL